MTIRRTLLLSFLVVSLLPTVVLTFLAFIQARDALEKEIARNLLAQASSAMAQIDWMLFERMENVRVWSHLEALQDVRISDLDKRASRVLADLKAGHEVYDHIFCTNREGKIVATSEQRLLGQQIAQQAAWLTVAFPGTVVSLAPLVFTPTTGEARLTLQAPIVDAFHPGELLGVLYAVFDWNQIFLILDDIERNAAAPEGGRRAALIDHQGRIIGASSLLRRQGLLFSAILASSPLISHARGGAMTTDGKALQLPEVLIGASPSQGYQHFQGFGWSTLVIQPTPQAFTAIHRMGGAFLLLLALTGMSAIGASLWIAARLARPLLQLTDFTRRFTHGQLLAASPQTGPQEVRELATAFLQMIQDLEQSREDLIRAAKLAVVGEMAAAMAHEVRTPLGILRTSAQMLQREPGLSAEAEEMAGFIVSETDRLNRLISTLLDLARPRPPVFQREDVHLIIRRAIELLAQRASRRKIRIEEALNAQRSVFSCDGEQLLQVFLNLILNALQILPEGGVIQVRTECFQDQLCIDIADNGPGIAQENRQRIFDPFFTTRMDGIGLGLTIVQQIVRTHEGEISVHDNPGGGVCFSLSLPYRRSNAGND